MLLFKDNLKGNFCHSVFINAAFCSSLPFTAAKSPLLPALCCLHEGCPEGRAAVHMFTQCRPLLVEKAGVAPDMTLRLTACKQVSVQAREPPLL